VSVRPFPSLVVDFVVRADTFASFSRLVFCLKNLVAINSPSIILWSSYGRFIKKGSVIAKDLVIDFQHDCRWRVAWTSINTRKDDDGPRWLRFESALNGRDVWNAKSVSMELLSASFIRY
jgi:hypothetical protein